MKATLRLQVALAMNGVGTLAETDALSLFEFRTAIEVVESMNGKDAPQDLPPGVIGRASVS